MARTTKRGTCELCGASANVGMNHGAKVCPQCTHVQSALNKRIESVAAAARSMGKTEELLGHLIPAGGLAVKVTADLLQEISSIVGYEGEDPAELVAAVRRRVLTCASCDSEDVLHEIREIVDYSPDMGDSGLADAVRDAITSPVPQCTYCIARRDDLLKACGIPAIGDSVDDGEGWDVAATAAIQTIAELINHRGDLLRQLTWERADNALMHIEIGRLNGQTRSESEQVTALRAELTLAEQSRDEWESRAVQAEENVEMLEAELKEAETRNGKLQYQIAGYAPEPCASTTYLLDIALKALRGEGPDADQLAVLIDAARRAA